MSLITVYVPCKDRAQARKIARTVVSRRLAACANLLGPMESHYEWKGKACAEKEFLLLLKTRKALFRKVEKAVRELHSYECPCIVALPLAAGNADFLSWVRQQTRAVG